MVTARESEVQEVIGEARERLNEAVRFLHNNGVDYSLSEWLTIKKYCERFGIKDTNVVSNWIKRGVIPSENIQVIEELNGLKLIKAISYKGE